VAHTISLREAKNDVVHRHRAISTLAGFTAVFMRCSVALMSGQSRQAVGAGLLVIAGAAAIGFRFGVYRTWQADHLHTFNLPRTAGSVGLYVVEMVGAVIFMTASVAGLYVAAIAMVANFSFLISGAWLLLIGAAVK
jgi:hypothetical protein